MFNATIKAQNKTLNIEFKAPALISEILEQGGFYMQKPCGGTGKCGKCKIRISGILSELTDKENEILSKSEILSGFRLACTTYAKSNVTVYYEDKYAIQGLTLGSEPDFIPEPISSKKDCYGCAVDIGTTTVAAYLYKFPECECVKSICLPNTQAKYGADVISRMEICENESGLNKLNKEIKTLLNKITKFFGKEIDTYVVTGNTVMLHVFNNVSPYSMAFSPFKPQTLFGEFYGNIYIPKCVSAFVGADVISSVLASDMCKNSKALLLDIGTNGEIVLKNENEYLCTSAAAGPSFEGADIEMGMSASDGSVSKVWSENGKVMYNTINNKSAVGICGTGLIDAVAVMLETEFMDSGGYIENDFFIGDSNVKITQKDIRQIQLAKSAIRSGIDILLKKANLSYNEIEQVYLAGGFGNYINKVSAAKIGLIPYEFVEKTVSIGNGAGTGASMILRSKKYMKISEEIAESAISVNLNEEKMFTDSFIDNMSF